MLPGVGRWCLQVLHLTFLSFFISSTLAQRFSILLTVMDYFERIDSLQFSFRLLAVNDPKANDSRRKSVKTSCFLKLLGTRSHKMLVTPEVEGVWCYFQREICFEWNNAVKNLLRLITSYTENEDLSNKRKNEDDIFEGVFVVLPSWLWSVVMCMYSAWCFKAFGWGLMIEVEKGRGVVRDFLVLGWIKVCVTVVSNTINLLQKGPHMT